MAPTPVETNGPACRDCHTTELYGFDVIVGHSIRLTGSERAGTYDIALHHNTGVTLFVICPSCLPQRVFHFDPDEYRRFLEGDRVPAQTVSKQDFDNAREVEYPDGIPFPFDREKDAENIVKPLMEQLAQGTHATKVDVSLNQMYVDARPLTYYSISDKDVVEALKKEFTARYKPAP